MYILMFQEFLGSRIILRAAHYVPGLSVGKYLILPTVFTFLTAPNLVGLTRVKLSEGVSDHWSFPCLTYLRRYCCCVKLL